MFPGCREFGVGPPLLHGAHAGARGVRFAAAFGGGSHAVPSPINACGQTVDSLGRGASIAPLLGARSAPVSPPLTPTPAVPAAKVVFGSQPGGSKNNNPAVQAGRALPTFTAIVVDVNGNRVAGATNAVTVALAPLTPGNVSCSATATARSTHP